MPSGWGIVGMNVVDSITQLAVSAGNAAISTFMLPKQLASAGLHALRSAKNGDADENVQTPSTPVNSSPNGISTLPNDNSVTDPALLETPIVLQLANALQQLISGGEGGKPDWEKIRCKDKVCRLYLLANCVLNSRSCSPGVAQTLSNAPFCPPRKNWTRAKKYRNYLMNTSLRVSKSS